MKFNQPISIVIKAYNEAENISRVLRVLAPIDWIDEVIVANDGSTDETAEVVAKFLDDKIKIVTNPKNLGMGGAMALGVKNAKSDLLLFLDADLVGLTEDHLLEILAPIIFTKKADLVLGVFGLKDLGEDTSTKIANRFMPMIAGQRAIWRKNLPPLSEMIESKFGADLLIAKNVPRSRREVVKLPGLSQITKEQKSKGEFGKAFTARMKMYKEVIKILLQEN
ncbi:MAG: glycosyltransferase [Candidatus Berkelbacteria bacterium]|nr:glycosyltransferase [Candidatus Berkelbacteria bacterium]